MGKRRHVRALYNTERQDAFMLDRGKAYKAEQVPQGLDPKEN